MENGNEDDNLSTTPGVPSDFENISETRLVSPRLDSDFGGGDDDGSIPQDSNQNHMMEVHSFSSSSSNGADLPSEALHLNLLHSKNSPLPPSYFPVLAEGSFSWTLHPVSSVLASDFKTLSPAFSVGGQEWYLQVLPGSLYLGIFLALKERSQRRSICVDIMFKAVSVDGRQQITRSTSYRYPKSPLISISSEVSDWGFQNFIPKADLTGEGSIVQDDTLIITIYIRIVKDDPDFLKSAHMQTLNENFKYGNSRQLTGFVGLHNQGATCYMNSILQSLFLTNSFRKATLQIPTNIQKPTDSIPLALQRIFYQLQFSDEPPNTNELTDSFGWDTYQAFTQHDVQEFLRALLDDLEGKMKKTPAEGSIERLFVSKVCQIVQCLNVEFESIKEDTLYDVQLPIYSCKTLKDSLDQFVMPQYLEGSNRYNAEGFGLQDAKMFSAFETLPPVLHLILMRYRYDVELDETVKINDRYEFPMEIDMTPYLRDKSPQKNQDNTFVLHSVLVHSGDLHGGHYCAFIKRDCHDPEDWYKFDDTKVSKVSSKEAVEDNYGEDISTGIGGEVPPEEDSEEIYKRADRIAA